MSVLEIKNLLHQFIANTNDERFLKILLMVAQEQKVSMLDWEKLPQGAKESIEEGLKQLDERKGKAHAQLIEKYKKWL